MDRKQVAKATTKVISSYLTYQAMQSVLSELTEMNPPLALWLRGFSGQQILQDGEVYLQALLAQNQELAFRIMTVREHLVEDIMEDLPEMVLHDIKLKNSQHRKQQLERLSQLSITEPTSQIESASE
ncbi:chaperonin family protein RbcX [Chamaesiphon polymorphus]|uniref:RbcX chaperonin protein n=1 Tax=Chamaesiphon polymorphus CCALA 037 TaxID=2107692 RepID=A0A2T1GDE4_9CYAN|nr:chaperonin family protein RbcX [Chamaesiphon polymorphus]PSB55435.1 RbcX chaperonin protein [Chamaesiphon polymorphus CCALA 037]